MLGLFLLQKKWLTTEKAYFCKKKSQQLDLWIKWKHCMLPF